MVKKMHSSPHSSSGNGAKGGSQAGQLASSVKDSAQQIWLAGMGAFSKAQEEGTKVFEALVKEGTSLQRKTQAVAEEKIGEVTGKMSAMADTVTAKAGQNWDKLESIFEARTAKAMHKLGVPTAKDLQALVGRVDELAAVVAELGRQGPAKPAARGAEAGKRAAKTTVSPAVKPAARAGVKPAVKPAVKLAAKGAAKVPAKRATRKSAAAA